MRKLAIVSALVASPAIAERMHLVPGDERCFAYVHIEDRLGTYNTTETLVTEHGPVSILYTTIGGHAAPDTAEVVSTPPDVIAIPSFIELTPSAVNRVCLILYTGA